MIRERVAEIIRKYPHIKATWLSCTTVADQILAITNPPVTVWVTCKECHIHKGPISTGGQYYTCDVCHKVVSIFSPNRSQCPNCTCTDGKVEREIVWEQVHEVCKGQTVDEANVINRRTLHLHDIIDPDVAWARGCLCQEWRNGGEEPNYITIPNNKGTLRIREAK
jgi:hypothetical protein